MRSYIQWAAVGIVVLLLVIQLVPYGRDHRNPPVANEPAWNSPMTRELAGRACMDCHSNETSWPWYANVAPMSWLVQWDVERGREALNWSMGGEREGEDSVEALAEGTMPPSVYTVLHPEARLTAEEIAALSAGLRATFGGGQGRAEDTREGEERE